LSIPDLKDKKLKLKFKESKSRDLDEDFTYLDYMQIEVTEFDNTK